MKNLKKRVALALCLALLLAALCGCEYRGDTRAEVESEIAALDADGDTVPGRDGISFELRSQFDAEILSVDHTGRGIVNCKDREFLEGPGRRHVFVPQLCEAVVSRHEEIVAGDVVVLPEGRTMAVDRQREHVPLLLDKRGERPPRLQRTKMHRLRFQLAQGARELRMRPLLPVADAVPVVERDITH